jgi:hypothetical protein
VVKTHPIAVLLLLAPGAFGTSRRPASEHYTSFKPARKGVGDSLVVHLRRITELVRRTDSLTVRSDFEPEKFD